MTTMLAEADLVASATDVAVTVTERGEATAAGELYVALVFVVSVKVPQAGPLHPVPVAVHVTPWLFTSLAKVAMKFTDCPWSMALLADPSETLIGNAFTVIE